MKNYRDAGVLYQLEHLNLSEDRDLRLASRWQLVANILLDKDIERDALEKSEICALALKYIEQSKAHHLKERVDVRYKGREVDEYMLTHSGLQRHELSRAKAMIELMRRLDSTEEVLKINNPKDLHRYLLSLSLYSEIEESLYLVSLTADKAIIGTHLLARGTGRGLLASPREVFIYALADKAVSIILAHNHPSGNLLPSKADMDFTFRIATIGQGMQVPLEEHLIFSKNGFYSFNERHYDLLIRPSRP